MSAVRMGRFMSISLLWEWTDDPAQDADFLAAVDPTGHVHPAVDRSGPAPLLRWTRDDVDRTEQQRELQIGQLWSPRGSYYNGTTSEPGVVSADGYWSCDEYGRPYNLADLQAPGMDPRIGQIQAHAAAIARDTEALDQ